MPLLFSYGTLQDERIQLSLFGRRLLARKDYLLGYEQALARVADPEFARTSGKSHHPILKPTRSRTAKVEGTVLELSEAELTLTDKYEPVEYRRVLAGLASGDRCWVYVDAQIGGAIACDDEV